MDVTFRTIGRPILVEAAHMQVATVPACIAHLLRDRLGKPYASTPTMARWAAVIEIPGHAHADARVGLPFELVICERGASVRCHWSQVDLLSGIMGLLVPEVFMDPLPVMVIAD